MANRQTLKTKARKARAKQFAGDPIGRAQDIARREAARQHRVEQARLSAETRRREALARRERRAAEVSGRAAHRAFAISLGTVCPVHGPEPCWVLNERPALCNLRIRAAGFISSASFRAEGGRS